MIFVLTSCVIGVILFGHLRRSFIMIDFEFLNKCVKSREAIVMHNFKRVEDFDLCELPKNFAETLELDSNGFATIKLRNLDNDDCLLISPSGAKLYDNAMILKIFNMDGVDGKFLNELRLLKKNKFFKKEQCPASFTYHHLECNDFKDSYFFNGIGIYDTFKDLQQAVSTLNTFYKEKGYKKENEEIKIKL